MAKRQTPANCIFEYYQKIRDGSIIVSKWIEMVYSRIIKDLEAGKYELDLKKANAAVEYLETKCFHTEGPLAPSPLKLQLWQKALVSCIFGLVDHESHRQYREVVLVEGRKNGKSILAAGIGKYVWHTEGYGTRVFCIAPKLDQADLIYNSIWQMTSLDPEWQALKEAIEGSGDGHTKRTMSDEMLAKRRQTDLRIEGLNSTVKKIAFSSRKSDGYNPSLCICDEVASWQGDQGLKQYEVLKSGMGARPEALLLSVSTSGYINDSIYDELIKRSTRFLMGDSKETKLLPFLYMIDDPEKWNDINELRKSMPNLGVSVPVDYILEEIAIAEGSLSKKAEFVAKYANLKQNSSLAWLPGLAVEKSSGPAILMEDFQNCYCVGGIDLSRTTDLTAACVVIERDGELYVMAKFFMPGEKLEEAKARDGLPYDIYVQRGLLALSGDNFVDYQDCFAWFRELVEKYQILPLQIGYDRYSAQYLVKDMEAYGFHMDDVFQGYNLTPVINETEGLIRDGRIHIGDNDLLKIHLLNAAIKAETQTERKKLVKLSANEHIDGAAALIDALTVRMKHWSEIGAQLQNRRGE